MPPTLIRRRWDTRRRLLALEEKDPVTKERALNEKAGLPAAVDTLRSTLASVSQVTR